MSMSIGEVIGREKGNYTSVELYRYTDDTKRLHTDFISAIENYNICDLYNMNVEKWAIMGAEEYNSTIYANCMYKFEDMFEPDEKILVIVVEDCYEYEYRWTANYDDSKPEQNYDQETESIICGDGYTFVDFLTDRDVRFVNDNDYEYFVVDEDGEKTGEAFWITNIKDVQ